MIELVESTKKVFVNGSPRDPGRGWAYCQTCQGEFGRVVHYILGWGWLGHAGHILEQIPDGEVIEFGLNAPGFLGRKRRLAYCSMRGRYSENPERFCREILVPAMNQTFKVMRRNQVE
jgi:hypothetical protein